MIRNLSHKFRDKIELILKKFSAIMLGADNQKIDDEALFSQKPNLFKLILPVVTIAVSCSFFYYLFSGHKYAPYIEGPALTATQSKPVDQTPDPLKENDSVNESIGEISASDPETQSLVSSKANTYLELEVVASAATDSIDLSEPADSDSQILVSSNTDDPSNSENAYFIESGATIETSPASAEPEILALTSPSQADPANDESMGKETETMAEELPLFPELSNSVSSTQHADLSADVDEFTQTENTDDEILLFPELQTSVSSSTNLESETVADEIVNSIQENSNQSITGQPNTGSSDLVQQDQYEDSQDFAKLNETTHDDTVRIAKSLNEAKPATQADANNTNLTVVESTIKSSNTITQTSIILDVDLSQQSLIFDKDVSHAEKDPLTYSVINKEALTESSMTYPVLPEFITQLDSLIDLSHVQVLEESKNRHGVRANVNTESLINKQNLEAILGNNIESIAAVDEFQSNKQFVEHEHVKNSHRPVNRHTAKTTHNVKPARTTANKHSDETIATFKEFAILVPSQSRSDISSSVSEKDKDLKLDENSLDLMTELLSEDL